MRLFYSAWLKVIWSVWDSDWWKKRIKKKNNEKHRIVHEEVFVEHRDHWVDVHILPVCEMLWEAGIETFYSCQGGPVYIRLRDKKIYYNRAYVQVYMLDADRVAKMLSHLHAEVETYSGREDNRSDKNKIAVRFDPSPEAVTIDMSKARIKTRNIRPTHS